MVLTDKENQLLMQLVNNNKCFDRRDNTFLLSNRKLADKVGVSPSKVDRLFRTLNKHNLVKKVINKTYNSNGSLNVKPVAMLSPKFLFISYTRSDRWFIGALWTLEHIKKVYEWSSLCRDLNCFICPDTGEMKPFNWYDIDRKANYYTSFDRCYRKKSKQIYNDYENEYQSQHYNLVDVDCYDLTTYDYIWIDSLVGWSDLPYNRNMQFYTKSPKNINSIKLEYDPRITECIQEMIKSGLITATR